MKRKGNAAAVAAQKASGSDTEKKVKERPKKAGPFNLNEEFPAEFAYTPVRPPPTPSPPFHHTI